MKWKQSSDRWGNVNNRNKNQKSEHERLSQNARGDLVVISFDKFMI